jgi:deferrochelatase/peroxidase EfeB
VNADASSVDHGDIQGLAAFAYAKLTQARYILARVKDPVAARAWCAAALARVSTAEFLTTAPDTAMQLAFTAEGLRSLGVAKSVLAGFSSEFLEGMAGSENRSRRLGDVAKNDPRDWLWGGNEATPHVAVLLYAKESLDAWIRLVLGDRWTEAFTHINCLETSNMGDEEPFGFRDGIAQPEIDWDRRRVVDGDQTQYGNIVSLGEFILGYANEYGKYTDRPLVSPQEDPDNDLLTAENAPDSKDLGRNGTYLVLRQLEQDVRGFWQFLDRVVDGNARERYQLGAAMVGRTRPGDPLMPDTSAAIAGVVDKPGQPRNRFIYDSDPRGTRCPLGAHIRRANPRNNDLPGNPHGPIARLSERLSIPRAKFATDLTSSTRFHRLLRRGREYGEKLDPEAALRPGPANEAPRGLQFACINANIVRQFEFVQNAWLMSSKFNGLTDQSDALLGNREPVGGVAADYFTIPREGRVARKIQRVPQFITVRGGAYFFLPSLRALRWITKGHRQ